MKRIVAGFDTETTGLLAPEHRIIESAVILYDLDTGDRLGQLIKRFNPGRPIEPEAQAVHHISFDQVSHLPKMEDDHAYLDMMVRIAQSSVFFVAHNGVGFDMPFIEQEYQRIGRSFPKIKCLDTMLAGTWATPNGKRPNLQELCFACRVPYDPSLAHAAEYDVERMMDCFFYGFRRGFFNLP